MRRLTLGTAGHIDHGKTRLVEALTGTDTDRLPEEQRRGISITLGYAELALPDGTVLSVVDVPGHERFVRTMVAGATGIDLFLLVVDAREGPKPQTFEHLRILRLLGVDAGVVAVTKADAADPEQIAATRAAAGRLVTGCEIVTVSALERSGLEELVAALGRVAARVEPRPVAGDARLYADRSFSLPGVGPVVTGTLWSGSIAAGDRLRVLPADYEARVRSVQVHGEPVERAEAGSRVAVAVASERHRRPSAGDALVAAGSFEPTYRLDVVLEEAGDLPAAARVTVCHGTSAVPARLRRSGERHAQLRLERPLVAAPGDRFVLRQETTVAGGRVLDAAPPRKLDEERIGRVEAGDLSTLVRRARGSGGACPALPARRASAREGAEPGPPLGPVRVLAGVARRHPCRSRDSTRRTRGCGRPGAAGLVPPAAPSRGRATWRSSSALDEHAGKLYLPGRRPSSGERGEAVAAGANAAQPFAVEDAALARQLEREGRLVALKDGLALTPDAYDRYKAIVVEECSGVGTIALARFRDLSGLSRKTAQLVLERLDSDRVTLRLGDVRRLRRGQGG